MRIPARKIIIPLATVWVLLCGAAVTTAAPVVREGEELTLDRCLEIAVHNQPEILQYLFAARVNEADLGRALSGYYPQLDAKSTFNSYNLARKTDDPYPQINSLYGYRYGDNTLNLTQKIYDFGKREDNVAVARLNVDSARMDMENKITAVVNNVKNAYYQVLKAKLSRDIEMEVRDQYRRQLEQARLFFAAGKKPKYDVTNAEVYLSGAELRLIDGENELSKAWVALNSAMGYDGSARYTIRELKTLEKLEITEQDALARAYRNRQDLQSLLVQKTAAERSVSLAKKDYFPSLDANAGYEFAGSQTPLAQGWNVGVGLTWNLFAGFSTQQNVQKALANLKITEAKIAAVRLQIRQDVQTALLNMKRADESIANAQLQVRQATENLELVNLRYQSGLATSLEVTIATVNFSQAKQTRVNAYYDYVRARANLEKAMGLR
ncbi:MAG TPA: TolC family protein [Syntrophales bacterium]|nr:TolC family protein [Syntrophales bacterium]HON23116.1 TolC family protein [Syntrophales bacterium]HPC32301.1 TolC family protein [Syntrophales bacterium]HRR46860.1 TolC family protein [Syntrophales bacterium]HRU88424.1 TolC family protein [Syntrophales bacterium]